MKHLIVLVIYFLQVNTQALNEDDLTYHFYNKTNLGNVIKYNQLDHIAGFNFTKPTFVLIHGWLGKANSSFNQEIKDVLLEKHDVNVVVVDWSKVAFNLYIVARLSVPTVGKYVGYLLKNITSKYGAVEENISFIGHSLGAHVSGIVGRALDSKPDLIVGLDPAFPFINTSDQVYTLSKADAKFVQVIHTGLITGIQEALGHADYFPNGGAVQPGCGVSIECYHKRSFHFYAESVKNNRFCSHSCTDYRKFKSGLCNDTSTSLMGGYPADKSASGKYYLETNAHSPYGKGPC